MTPPVLYTGIDLHKRTLTATTLDPAGAVVSAKLPCRRDALALYFADLDRRPHERRPSLAQRIGCDPGADGRPRP